MTITPSQFKKATGHDAQQDDLDRVNCEQAGQLMHSYCGWCEDCNRPVFQCGHKKEPK